MARFVLIMASLFWALPALAQSDDGRTDEGRALFAIGADSFMAGNSVTLDQAGRDDLFATGQSVTVSADVTGSIHAAGRRVFLGGKVGGDIYAAGMEVVISGPVAGDVTAMGYEVTVANSVAGDLRAMGATVRVEGPVAGYAILSGESVILNGTIGGDVSLQAGEVTFGPDARIDGQLTIYEKPDEKVEIAASVLPADRITRRAVTEWKDSEGARLGGLGWRHVVRNFLYGVLFVAIVAGLIAGIAPTHLSRMRNRLLDAPFRTLWFGFLTQSTLIGSAILFALTVVGIVVAPASILAALLIGFFGYVIGAYALGVGLILLIGRSEPDGLAERVVAAFIGALVAGVIALIPLLGWIFVLALTLAGIGAITQAILRPAFFVRD